ncbi:hypothetical protein UPYG_G00171250 [Umbra pygmaea]|uniref:MIF4G domain-containing protein n=1 Tax=Umbra pygmaea TaxID=75934 RepID=A0ABD0X9R1_UMBPY
MSLPPKIVKPPTVAVSGPGTGPSPSSQLRATLTSVSLPPGAPGAPQPNPVPPPQIPRIPPALEDRHFPPQPGVTAVYSVPRHPGTPYTAHDITKGHPNLAGTPPGHAHSPALSQVPVPTASPYRYPKGWETGGGSPYTTGQNAGSNPLVYSPQTQQLNAQPQSRPSSSMPSLSPSPPVIWNHQFAPGPRPTHHQGGFRPIQFFQRAQMQTARPAIPTNTPSLRPGSQNPTAAVYPPSQPTMMMMAPMPFPSPQTAQYYIPQYRHSTPYVGPPQQFSVQPPGSGTFYPGPGPGEFPAQYAPGPQFYPGQQVYPPSPPIIVPTPQQPPPTKREKKTIRIRDPNQGGRDITEEIMAGGTGGTGSRNPTPPVGRPSSTPTPPQQLGGSQTPEQVPGPAFSLELPHQKQPPQQFTPGSADSKPGPDEKPKFEAFVQKSSSPGIKQPDGFLERREASAPGAPFSLVEPECPSAAQVMTAPISAPCPVASLGEQPSAMEPASPASSCAAGPLPPVTKTQTTANSIEPLPEAPNQPAALPAPTATLKALNGHADAGVELDAQAPEPSPPAFYPSQPKASAVASTEDCKDALPSELRGEMLTAVTEPITQFAVVPITLNSCPAAFPAPPPGLPPLVKVVAEPGKLSDTKDIPLKAGTEALVTPECKPEPQLQAPSRNSPTTVRQTAPAAPKTLKKPNEGSPVEESPQRDMEEFTGNKEELNTVDEAAVDPGLLPVDEAAVDPGLLPARPRRTSSPPPPSAASALEPEEKTQSPEENGEAELEPMGNGADHTSETESSDSGVTPGDKEESAGVHPELFQDDLTETNGKRQYGREFLLGFQFMAACTQKPDGLPQISDVVLDKINQNKLPGRAVESRLISRGPDFTPSFADFGRQMSGGRGGAAVSHAHSHAHMMNMGGSARRPPPRKIILNVSANDEVQLKKAENAWKPGMKRAGPSDDPEVVTTQELFRKVRSILNKLTPQMFNQLMKQVTDLTIDTEERLKGVIDLVFEKAIDEPGFSVAYGNMCRVRHARLQLVQTVIC